MATVAVIKNKTTMKGGSVVHGLSGQTPGVTSAPMAPKPEQYNNIKFRMCKWISHTSYPYPYP